ncbi:hypothetical protein [Loktanella sp. S4079]|uniref:hypothetical protein n=1 Tax=Loktanella sp. S4079 TaxID=579483 RepID=UPI0005FA7FC3|nr:hypothetical protein [Loktanella sp. S4079]KJZ19863.1 hypothetical protein TW80_02995 [Loktanella sp. S4079]
MSLGPKSKIFLEQAGYRQRRVRDAVRLLPLLGIVLLSIPLLWPRLEPPEAYSSGALVYIFGVWVALIAISAFLSRTMHADDDEAAPKGGSDA